MQIAKAPDTISIQRKVVVRVNSGRRTENETFAAHIMDHGRLFGPVDLAAQPAHMHVDQIALRYEFVVPDLLEEHGARKQLILAVNDVLEQGELAGQEIHVLSAAL